MYRLIALDLDGTLTNSKKELTDRTQKVLSALGRKGVSILLASGRPTPGLYQIAHALDFEDYGGYLLSFNGAKVVNYHSGEVEYEVTIPASTAHELFDRGKAFGLSPLTYDAERIITQDIGDHWIQLESYTTTMPIHHVQDFKKAVDFDVNKVLMTGEPSYVAQIIDDFKAPYEKTLSIYRSDPYFIECMAAGVDKAKSLAALCEKLNIRQEETIGFGDGYNDLSFIEWCHCGVAMANAVAEVKARADDHTLSNDEDGVAVYLEKLIAENLI